MLKIRLRNGEKMVVNGAVLRADCATTLWLENDASILRGREVMRPEEADTPARRLYFACMLAYLDPGGREKHQHDIITLLGDLIGAITTPAAKATCVAMAHDIACGQFYRALTHCRTLITHEATVLGLHGTTSSMPTPSTTASHAAPLTPPSLYHADGKQHPAARFDRPESHSGTP